MALGVALYAPFVRLADRMRARTGGRLLDGLLHAAEGSGATGHTHRCLDRAGAEGRLARALAEDLHMALRQRTGLYLEYQPQIGTDEGRIHGVEALVRWRHPALGLIPPPVIVALAEDLGIIERLGTFVLTAACEQRSNWEAAVPSDLIMSVNVSPRQLAGPGFDDVVLGVLRSTGLAPHLLELEITESTVLVPERKVLEALLRLRRAGVRIAIDDFGMGHASLRYLCDLPVDTVKIDRSLTLGGPGTVNEQVVRSIAELGRSLGITTIVEGVEVDEQVERFRRFGCATFQGYLFSRPLQADACLSYIRDATLRDPRWPSRTAPPVSTVAAR